MSVHITYTGDASGLLAEEGKLVKSAADLDAQYKSVANSAAKLEREIKKAWESTLPPIDKYNKAVAAADKLLKQKRITQEQHAHAVQRAGEEYKKATRDVNVLTQAFDNLTSIDIAKYFAGAVTGMMGAQAAADGILNTVRAVDQMNKDAAAKTAESEAGLAPLAQLAVGDPKKFNALADIAEKYYAAGAAANLGEAGKTIYTLQSTNQMHHLQLLTDVASRRVIENMPELLRNARQMQFALGPDKTGEIDSQLAKALKAGEPSSTSAESVMGIAARSGQVGGMLQVHPDQLLAAASILADVMNEEMSGSHLNSLMTSLAEHGDVFKNKTIPEMVAIIDGMNLTFENLQKLLDRTEAVKAFATLKLNLPEFERRVSDIQKATPQYVQQLVETPASRENLDAAFRDRQAGADAEIAGSHRGKQELLQSAAFKNEVARLERSGAYAQDILAAKAVGSVADVVNIPPTATESVMGGFALWYRMMGRLDFQGALRQMRGTPNESAADPVAVLNEKQDKLIEIQEQSLKVQTSGDKLRRIVGREKVNRPQ